MFDCSSVRREGSVQEMNVLLLCVYVGLKRCIAGNQGPLKSGRGSLTLAGDLPEGVFKICVHLLMWG